MADINKCITANSVYRNNRAAVATQRIPAAGSVPRTPLTMVNDHTSAIRSDIYWNTAAPSGT